VRLLNLAPSAFEPTTVAEPEAGNCFPLKSVFFVRGVNWFTTCGRELRLGSLMAKKTLGWQSAVGRFSGGRKRWLSRTIAMYLGRCMKMVLIVSLHICYDSAHHCSTMARAFSLPDRTGSVTRLMLIPRSSDEAIL
jgi:hypothetical protein